MLFKKYIIASLVMLNLFLLYPIKKVEATYCAQETKSLYLDKNKSVNVFNNSGVYLTQSDIDLMAKIVYGESRGEPFDGKVAVASVILNRVKDSRFPDTVPEVITSPGAFSCVCDGVIDVVASEECYSAVYEAILRDEPFVKCTFFYNPEIATCDWMKNIQKDNVTQIGNHVFFEIN
ncbi:MAG: cell wall hydrolase [Clostridium sp.]